MTSLPAQIEASPEALQIVRDILGKKTSSVADRMDAAKIDALCKSRSIVTLQQHERTWRCFHCDEAFTDKDAARLHFGDSELSDPACQIDAEKYREMERLHERDLAEDTDKDRAIYRMQSDHGVALRREEEKGYARGLRDAGYEAKQHERLEAMVKGARQWRLSLEDDGWDEKAIMDLARPGIYALFSALAALGTAAPEAPTGMSPNNPSERAE